MVDWKVQEGEDGAKNMAHREGLQQERCRRARTAQRTWLTERDYNKKGAGRRGRRKEHGSQRGITTRKVQEGEDGAKNMAHREGLQQERCRRARTAQRTWLTERDYNKKGAGGRGRRKEHGSQTGITTRKVQEGEDGTKNMAHRQGLQQERCRRARTAQRTWLTDRDYNKKGAGGRGRHKEHGSQRGITTRKVQEGEDGAKNMAHRQGLQQERCRRARTAQRTWLTERDYNKKGAGGRGRRKEHGSQRGITTRKVQEGEDGAKNMAHRQGLQQERCRRARTAQRTWLTERDYNQKGAGGRGRRKEHGSQTGITTRKVQEGEDGSKNMAHRQGLQQERCRRARTAQRTWFTDRDYNKKGAGGRGRHKEHGSQTGITTRKVQEGEDGSKNMAHRQGLQQERCRRARTAQRTWLTERDYNKKGAGGRGRRKEHGSQRGITTRKAE